MLITVLSYFSRFDTNNENYYDNYSIASSTGSIVSDSMSANNEEDEWQQISSFPMSIEDDYEIVLPEPNIPEGDDTLRPTGNNAGNESILQRMREWHHQRSLQKTQLGKSISKTFAEFSQEDPKRMEEEAIQRAIELSMLDTALVHCDHYQNRSFEQEQRQLPHKILNVAEDASPAEIKTAYRKLARLHHPDKGGDAHRFEEIARAYRSLLSPPVPSSLSQIEFEETPRLTTATCDKELQDHRRLVNDLFQADGMDLEACVTKQLRALNILGLTFQDAGAINRNERNEIIHNSCFYLSLATSYLCGLGALSVHDNEGSTPSGNNGGNIINLNEKEEDQLLVGDTALMLKRTIEAAVVKAHPEWVLQGKVGEEVQAFSDFLVYTLDSQTLLSDWAVIVFDATSGFCDIYKGLNYDKQKSNQANTITLRYIPGHYQALVPADANLHRPTLSDITARLDDLGVFYVITDGRS